RVGDGSAALGLGSTPVFLDEYTTNGTLVQSSMLPTNGSTAFTAVGTSTTEGDLTASPGGSLRFFTRYRKAAGGSNPSTDTITTTPRVIGTFAADGTISTAIALTNIAGMTTAKVIRSATSVNGASAFWIGTSSDVDYVGAPSADGCTATLIDARNS